LKVSKIILAPEQRPQHGGAAPAYSQLRQAVYDTGAAGHPGTEPASDPVEFRRQDKRKRKFGDGHCPPTAGVDRGSGRDERARVKNR